MWELMIRVLCSLPKVLFWKLRYLGRLQLPLVQAFGKHAELHIKGNAKVSIGKETVSRTMLVLRAEDGALTIGDKCFFNMGCSITCKEKITIGDCCQIANQVVMVDHDHDYKKGWGHYVSAPITIGNDVWIGAGCVILKGSCIGDGAVIGAGSIVNGTVAPHSVYYQKRETIQKYIENIEE